MRSSRRSAARPLPLSARLQLLYSFNVKPCPQCVTNQYYVLAQQLCMQFPMLRRGNLLFQSHLPMQWIGVTCLFWLGGVFLGPDGMPCMVLCRPDALENVLGPTHVWQKGILELIPLSESRETHTHTHTCSSFQMLLNFFICFCGRLKMLLKWNPIARTGQDRRA